MYHYVYILIAELFYFESDTPPAPSREGRKILFVYKGLFDYRTIIIAAATSFTAAVRVMLRSFTAVGFTAFA